MNNRWLQGALVVWGLVLAHGWAAAQPGPSPALPTPGSAQTQVAGTGADGLPAWLASSTRSVQNWNANETGVLQELRRGLARLEKGCAQKPGPARSDAASGGGQQAFEEALALRESRAAAFERQAQQWSAQSLTLTGRQCAGVSNALGLDLLKSPACRRAEAVQQGLQGLRSELNKYHQLLLERYRTYGGLAQLEQQSCSRPGFAGRLMQANDIHMRPAETRQLELADQWSREITDQLRKMGDQP